MANSGPNTNGSQFFFIFRYVTPPSLYITGCRDGTDVLAGYRPTSHLDNKHTVFGRVAGGMETLDQIEAVGNDKKERPLEEITLVRAQVFVNPIAEAEELLR